MYRWLLFSPKIDLLLRLLLAGVFVVAAVPKLLAPGEFAVIIAGYGLTPPALNPLLAVALPLLELVLAGMLLLDRRGAVLGAILLLTGFTAILAYGIHLGLDVDCGCFGPEDPEGKAYHGLRQALVRDLWLLGCCGWLALRRFFLHTASGPAHGGLRQTM